MGKFSDILGNANDGDQLKRAWDTTEAAEEFVPLPKGEYVARIEQGELSKSALKGTPCFNLTFRVLEGPCAGRKIRHSIYLTVDSMPYAKRDLGKLGIKSMSQLEQPLPSGIRCSVNLVVHSKDDGTTYNSVRSFEVLGVDSPEPDEFAPRDLPPSGEGGHTNSDAKASQTADDGIAPDDSRKAV